MSERIAILYEKFDGIGGEPKVLLELAGGLRADVITSIFREDIYPEFSLNIHTFISNDNNWREKKITPARMAYNFLQLDLSGYDVIITGGRLPMLVALKKNRPHLIHYEQPPSLSDSVFYKIHEVKGIASKIKSLPKKIFIKNIVKRIDTLVANSNYIKENIYKYYKIISKVIYPPVDIKKFKCKKEHEDFFLSVQRFTPAKRVEIQIKAFKKLPDENLVVVGTPVNREYLKRLRENAPKNVEFFISVSDKKLIELYASCKATIQTSKAEPFGLVPVESMASGKPCIAVNEGGFKETIIHGKTGILINEPYIDNLVDAIKNFDKYDFNPKILRKRAEYFSLDRFIMNFKQLIEEVSNF